MHFDINEYLFEFCKYQHELLKKYKEYIEQNIHAAIKDDSWKLDDPRIADWVECQHIKIPETEFVMVVSPSVKYYWNLLQYERPFINPDIFVKVLYEAKKQQDEEETQKNANSN